MATKPFTLSEARVLVSNDDGINAPGLKVLERIARTLTRDVWVVAPETEQSAASHSLTRLRPLRIRKVGKRRFAIDGSPTDCVLLGVRHVMADNPPDIVLSGINPGGNLCDDVTYSGTIAAAMEGALLGLRGIALSLAVEGAKSIRWATVEKWAPEVFRLLSGIDWPNQVVLNVNFPNVPASAVTGIAVTRQGTGKTGQGLVEMIDPHGNPIFWLGTESATDRIRNGEDVEAIKRGAISVIPLSLDLTPCFDIEGIEVGFSVIPDSRKIRLILDLRRNGVTDTRVLAAMERIPRHHFVLESFRDRAYDDVALPIGRYQTVSQPTIVARMTQALEVGDRMKVLEIGTGSGYQAAILASLCRRLYTIERHRALLLEAEQRLDSLGFANVTTAVRDGSEGWPEQAPFDRIIVTAAATEAPEGLARQLAEGGVMVVPVGPMDADQRLCRIRRRGEEYETDDLGSVRFVPLVPGTEDV